MAPRVEDLLILSRPSGARCPFRVHVGSHELREYITCRYTSLYTFHLHVLFKAEAV